jgi:Protein NO VEIN, C-terminal
MMKLFLVPASKANLEATVIGSVSTTVAERFLSPGQSKFLKNALGNQKTFHCWAVTESLRSTFERMESGDAVLLTVKGTGMFSYFAHIIHKVESEELGNHLWSYTPGKPWKLIYILDDVCEVAINKSELVSALGYQSNDMVAGTRRVRDEYLAKVSGQYGSLQKFMEAMAGRRLPIARSLKPTSPGVMSGSSWSDEEVTEIVRDYLQMLVKELGGQRYSKTEYRKALLLKLKDRSERAIEFKFQIISAALINKNLPYIAGYQPLKQYQAGLDEVINRELEAHPSLIELINQTAHHSQSKKSVATSFDEVVVEAPEWIHQEHQEKKTRRSYQSRKYDFARREAQNRRLGEQGEEFVLKLERERLTKAGRHDLADKVERVSVTKGDGIGYDIQSFEVDGSDRFIEVKTSNFAKSFPFYISANELEFSMDHAENYYLYRVFDFKKLPRLFMLRGSLGKKCQLTPTIFKASF